MICCVYAVLGQVTIVLTALSAKLTEEIAGLEKDIQGYQASLTQAKAIREKELAEVEAEEKDMLEATGARKAAVEMLAKHHTSFLQMPQIHLQSGAEILQHEMQKHSNLLTHSQRRTVVPLPSDARGLLQRHPDLQAVVCPAVGSGLWDSSADV